MFNSKITLKQLSIVTIEFSKFFISNNKLSKTSFVHRIRENKSYKMFILMTVNLQKQIPRYSVLAKMNSFKVRDCFRMPNKWSVKPA